MLISKLNKIKHMCIYKKIPLFGISVYSKILYLANVLRKADAKDLAHRVALKSNIWKHTWKRHTNCRRGFIYILISFTEILVYSSYRATSTQSHLQ